MSDLLKSVRAALQEIDQPWVVLDPKNMKLLSGAVWGLIELEKRLEDQEARRPLKANATKC